MATIKEIAEIVGVSSAAVSRVLNYDEGISVSQETRESIFAVAEKLGYKKKVIYPKIENVTLLYWVSHEEELEDIYYQAIHSELIRQAKKMNIQLSVVTKEDGLSAIKPDSSAFVAIGWLNRKELNKLYKICKKGVFIDTSPDEKLFDAVRPNLDSFVTQMVDYYVKKGHKTIGFVGGTDRNIDTEKPSMDVREWSFRQSAIYYNLLNEDYIYIADRYTVAEGYRLGKILAESGKLPTALCLASDTLAIGLLQAFHEEGIQIPEQVSVFSINDVSVAQYVSPPLTTFHIDIPLLCETALDLLRDRVLKGGKITKTVFINGIPVFRKSCK
ncbi:LacI family transcriptional regulator [Anaerotaenia torta]|uniref:LacI family DNA-binding transcriptional regulator n=1 Tax=Anaerotaenia torta TaxID=433293 RepID=UPI003D234558